MHEILWVIIIIIVIVVAVVILYYAIGAGSQSQQSASEFIFRNGKIAGASGSRAVAAALATDRCKELVNLWGAHVNLTRRFIEAYINKSPDFDSAQKDLLQNQVDLGNLYAKFCGPAKGKQITDLLTTHILQAKAIVVAAGNKQPYDNLVKEWYVNADQLAAAFAGCLPTLTLAHYKEEMKVHLDTTLVEYKAIVGGNKVEIESAYRIAYDHMIMFARAQCQ